MRLLFDIGNNRIKWALDDGGALKMRVISHRQLSESELSSPNSELCRLFDSIAHPELVFVSSVGPDYIADIIRQRALQVFSLPTTIVRVTSSVAGIDNAYADLSKLGVDRWVAAIGARAQTPGLPLIVIDAGTAVTVDVLDQQNVFQGGVIMPGSSLMHLSLNSGTAGVESHPAPANGVIGKTTAECVNAGVHFGLVGAVERIVAEMQSELARQAVRESERGEQPAEIILTGGDAPLIRDNSDLDFIYEPALVLLGLRELAAQQVTPMEIQQ